MKTLGAHQPDIFPYAGFFNKMNKSDYFDIAIFDEYSKGRFMDRVKIGKLSQLTWLNVPIERKKHSAIMDIKLKPTWKELLLQRIERQYKDKKKDFPFYDERKYIVENVLDNKCETLADVGFSSIVSIKSFFEIQCTIDFLGDQLPTGTEGLLELTSRYSKKYDESLIYLSGAGGKDYMDIQKFRRYFPLEFNDYDTEYKCSVLTPIFALENPKEIIL